MFNNGMNAAPISAAKKPANWWLHVIDDFNELEITPCKLHGYDQAGREIVQACELPQVSIWGVRAHYSRDGCKHILDDFDTKGEAQKFYNRLVNVYPHLAYWRPQPRFSSRSQLTL